jgi:hypothetical protein
VTLDGAGLTGARGRGRGAAGTWCGREPVLLAADGLCAAGIAEWLESRPAVSSWRGRFCVEGLPGLRGESSVGSGAPTPPRARPTTPTACSNASTRPPHNPARRVPAPRTAAGRVRQSPRSPDPPTDLLDAPFDPRRPDRGAQRMPRMRDPPRLVPAAPNDPLCRFTPPHPSSPPSHPWRRSHAEAQAGRPGGDRPAGFSPGTPALGRDRVPARPPPPRQPAAEGRAPGLPGRPGPGLSARARNPRALEPPPAASSDLDMPQPHLRSCILASRRRSPLSVPPHLRKRPPSVTRRRGTRPADPGRAPRPACRSSDRLDMPHASRAPSTSRAGSSTAG